MEEKQIIQQLKKAGLIQKPKTFEQILNGLYRGENPVHVIWQGKVWDVDRQAKKYTVQFDNANFRMFAPYMIGIYKLDFQFKELEEKYWDKIRISEEITFHFDIIPTTSMCDDIKVNSSKLKVNRDKILADALRPIIFPYRKGEK